MHSYVIIDPEKRQIVVSNVETLHDAERLAGLDPQRVDHGTLARGFAYVIFEYANFVPPADQHYFALGRQLFSGAIVVYGYDHRVGDTINVTMRPCLADHQITLINSDDEMIELDLRWLTGAEAVAAVDAGEIDRLELRVKGQVRWAWPEPVARPREMLSKIVDEIE